MYTFHLYTKRTISQGVFGVWDLYILNLKDFVEVIAQGFGLLNIEGYEFKSQNRQAPLSKTFNH